MAQIIIDGHIDGTDSKPTIEDIIVSLRILIDTLKTKKHKGMAEVNQIVEVEKQIKVLEEELKKKKEDAIKSSADLYTMIYSDRVSNIIKTPCVPSQGQAQPNPFQGRAYSLLPDLNLEDDIEEPTSVPTPDSTQEPVVNVSGALDLAGNEDPLNIKDNSDSDSDSEDDAEPPVTMPTTVPDAVVLPVDPLSGLVPAEFTPTPLVLRLIQNIGTMAARLKNDIGKQLQVNGAKLIKHLVDLASRLLNTGLSAEQQQLLSNLLNSLKNLLINIGKGMAGIQDLVMDLLEKTADFIDVLINLGSFTIDLCEKLWSFIKVVWTYILKPLGCVIVGLADVLKWLYNQISSALCKIIEKISGTNFRKIREEVKAKSGVRSTAPPPPPPKHAHEKKQTVKGLRQKLNEIGILLKEAGLPLPDGQNRGDVKRDMHGKLARKGGKSKRYNRKFSKKYKMTNTIKSRQQQKQNNKKISQRR